MNSDSRRCASYFVGVLLYAGMSLLPADTLADCTPSTTGTAGPDQILCDNDNDAAGADVNTFAGNDTLDLSGSSIGTVDAGSGSDYVQVTFYPLEQSDK